MTVLVQKSDFILAEIGKDYHKNFVAKDCLEVTHMGNFLLKTVGDAFREKGSDYIWKDGSYAWFTDESQSHMQRVFLTESGILILEDCNEERMWRVFPK